MKFHVYKDSKDEWRWRLKAANGKVIADSGEDYTTKQACKDGIDLVKTRAAPRSRPRVNESRLSTRA
jgi:uncharacterized protein YegP (UPF0339 family)